MSAGAELTTEPPASSAFVIPELPRGRWVPLVFAPSVMLHFARELIQPDCVTGLDETLSIN